MVGTHSETCHRWHLDCANALIARQSHELTALREQAHRLADDLAEAQRLNESYARPHLTAYSNGA